MNEFEEDYQMPKGLREKSEKIVLLLKDTDLAETKDKKDSADLSANKNPESKSKPPVTCQCGKKCRSMNGLKVHQRYCHWTLRVEKMGAQGRTLPTEFFFVNGPPKTSRQSVTLENLDELRSTVRDHEINLSVASGELETHQEANKKRRLN